MNKRILAITVSTVLLANSMAFAGNTTIKSFSDKELDQALTSELDGFVTGGRGLSAEQMKMGYKEVIALKEKLIAAGNSNESDPVIKYGNYVEALMTAISTTVMSSHSKSDQATESKLKLAAGTMALVIHTAVSLWKRHGKIDATVMSAEIRNVSTGLDKMPNMPNEISSLKLELNNLSTDLIKNQSLLDQKLENVNDVESIIAIANIFYFGLHMLYPKATQEADGFFKNVLPKIQQIAGKVAEASKGRTVALGTTGTLGIGDILGLTLGMSSKQAQGLVDSTTTSLDSIATKYKMQISARQ